MKPVAASIRHALGLALGFTLAFGLIPKLHAAEPVPAVGIVKTVSGDAVLLRGSAQLPLQVGQRLQVGDLIRTGASAGAGITLADDTLLATGPNSELVVSEFSFDPTTQQGGMLLSLWRGVVSVVTGLIAKKTPDKVNVQTRTVVLGVRGTEFVVESGERLPQ